MNPKGFALALTGWSALLFIALLTTLLSGLEHDTKRVLGLIWLTLLAFASVLHLLIRIFRSKRIGLLGYLIPMLVVWFVMHSALGVVWRAQCCAYGVFEGAYLRGILQEMTRQEQEGKQPLLVRDGEPLFRDYLSQRCCRFDLDDFTYAGLPLEEVLNGDWTEEQLVAMQAAEQERWGSGPGFDFVGPFVVRIDAPLGGMDAGFESEEPVGMLIFGGPASHTSSVETHHIVFGDHQVEWLFADEAVERSLQRLDVLRRMGLPDDVANRWLGQFATE